MKILQTSLVDTLYWIGIVSLLGYLTYINTYKNKSHLETHALTRPHSATNPAPPRKRVENFSYKPLPTSKT